MSNTTQRISKQASEKIVICKGVMDETSNFSSDFDTSYYEECEVEFSKETIEAINGIDRLFDSCPPAEPAEGGAYQESGK